MILFDRDAYFLSKSYPFWHAKNHESFFLGSSDCSKLNDQQMSVFSNLNHLDQGYDEGSPLNVRLFFSSLFHGKFSFLTFEFMFEPLAIAFFSRFLFSYCKDSHHSRDLHGNLMSNSRWPASKISLFFYCFPCYFNILSLSSNLSLMSWPNCLRVNTLETHYLMASQHSS